MSNHHVVNKMCNKE